MRERKYAAHAVMRTASGIPSPSPTFRPIELSEPDEKAGVSVGDVVGGSDSAVDGDNRVLMLLLVVGEVVDGVWVNRTREPLRGG